MMVTEDYKPLGLGAAVVANLSIVLWLVWALFLNDWDHDLYYLSVQEDEYIEWATFWAFMSASWVFVLASIRQRRNAGEIPWFMLGVALFCFLVAMEEISWAQRIIGYRPPQYFLRDNFQQEFNVHNVFSTNARQFTVDAVTLGYGVLLPLAALIGPLRRMLDKLAIVAPPWGLMPAFLATFLFYYSYPLDYSGETAEVMLGLDFLFSGLVCASWQAGRGPAPAAGRGMGAVLGVSGLLILCLGLATAWAERHLIGGSSAKVEQAQLEVDALAADLQAIAEKEHDKYATSCDRHKRIYSYETKYHLPYLYKGRFASLAKQGVPAERTKFFLDPWNAPYWIRDRCGEKGQDRVVFVYSFGPNRKRDSTRREILGDDVGAFIRPAR